MTFTKFADLSPEQTQAVTRRWIKNLDGYEYQFSKTGEPLARRSIKGPKPPRPAVVASPSPAAEKVNEDIKSQIAGHFETPPAAGPVCEKCGLVFTPKGIGPHRKHCKGPASADVLAGAAISSFPFPEAPSPAQRETALNVAAIITSAAAPSIPISPEFIAHGDLIEKVPLVCMVDSPTQPRTVYKQSEHEELTQSMREHGWVKSGAALLRLMPGGPAAVAAPLALDLPEGEWHLLDPETRAPLILGKFSEKEAEHLCATKYARRYEIIAGHRRTRAARSACLVDAPAVIVDWSDMQVLEWQLVENNNRADLNPMDEADHITRLLAARERGLPVHTFASLAARVGKSAQHIRDVASLCVLEGLAREAVANGALALRIAYVIAQIPDAESREKATAEILNPTEGEAPMRSQAALDYIRRVWTRNLRTEAKFPTADATLVPERRRINTNAPDGTERYFGGDCLSCTFNSAFDPDPSKPGTRLGVCGNVACFEAKNAAEHERWRAQKNQPEKGRIAVTPERNAEIFDKAGEIAWDSGLVALDAAPDAGLLKADVLAAGEETPTWRALAKGHLSEIIVARHPTTGKTVEVIDVNKAKAAAELNEHRIFKTSKARHFSNTAAGDAAHKAETLATKRQQEINRRAGIIALATLASKAAAQGHFRPTALLTLAEWLLDVVEDTAASQVETRRRAGGPLAKQVLDFNEGDLVGLVVELMVADLYATSNDEIAFDVLDAYGVNLEDAKRAAEAELSAEENAGDATAPARDPSLPHGEGWHALKFTREQIGTRFHFNEHGICENPDEIAVDLPTTKKEPLSVKLTVAYDASAQFWFAASDIDGKQWQASHGVSNKAASYETRFGALAAEAAAVSARLDAEDRVSKKSRDAMRALVVVMQDLAAGEAGLLEERGAAVVELPVLSDDLPPEAAAPTSAPVVHIPVASLELEPVAALYDQPSFVAVIRDASQPPEVFACPPADFDALFVDSEVLWICLLAGIVTEEAARAAAVEALAARAGEITPAGVAAGWHRPTAVTEGAAV